MLKIYFIIKDNDCLRDHLGKIIPTELESKYNISFKDNISIVDKIENLDNDLHTDCLDEDILNIIIFFDRQRTDFKPSKYCQAFFLYPIDSAENSTRYCNQMKQQMAKGIRALFSLKGNFADKALLPIMRLPRKNFHSTHLNNLYTEIEKGIFNNNTVQKYIYDFSNNHRKPKRRTSNKQVKFFEDARSLYFLLENTSSGNNGHGIHRPTVNQNGHNITCILNNSFRFGYRINHRLHFDVSKNEGQNIPNSIPFCNCHDEIISFKEKDHLNIFSNDFIRST